MKRLRQGMTVADRDKLREVVMERQLALAYRRSAEYGLSPQCLAAMTAGGGKPWQARELHESCTAEEPGGTGCLCVHHDVRDTAVISGTVPSPPALAPAPAPGGPDARRNAS